MHTCIVKLSNFPQDALAYLQIEICKLDMILISAAYRHDKNIYMSKYKSKMVKAATVFTLVFGQREIIMPQFVIPTKRSKTKIFFLV